MAFFSYGKGHSQSGSGSSPHSTSGHVDGSHKSVFEGQGSSSSSLPHHYPSTQWFHPPYYLQQYQPFDQENGRPKSDFNMQVAGMPKWIIDSEASKHMVNDSKLLTNFTSLPRC
ncbi:hypothetical protein H5410_038437 [Solanum commersonii]|uniref:Uncharacterized protein n=1 Tax=Solanum commersonii TaxID=4109 RepID=A0A9J5YAP3_SOLCO|nr:hypothetical protein H5410_038437 [Solanum commersonii]